MKAARRKKTWWITLLMAAFCLLWLYPFMLAVLNSFKSNGEMMSNVLAFPTTFRMENYVDTWKSMNYPLLFRNNIIYTVGGVLGIVVLASLAGYKLARTNTRYSKVVFYIFIIPMMIPFQTIMITFTRLASMLGLTGTIAGVVLFQCGFGVPMATFLYKGYMGTIPKDLDESASIDGAGPMRTFWSIIFPLMRPITATVVVVNALGIWNDFMIVLLLLGSSEKYMNIPLAIYNSFGTYYANWESALPGMVFAVIPAIVLFVLLQKQIMQGITAGAVKG